MFKEYYRQISLHRVKHSIFIVLTLFSIYWYLLMDTGFQNRPNELFFKIVYLFSFVDEILGVFFLLLLCIAFLKLFELKKSAWKILLKTLFLIIVSTTISLAAYYYMVTSLPKEEIDSLAPVVLVLYYGKSVPMVFSISLIILDFITGKSGEK